VIDDLTPRRILSVARAGSSLLPSESEKVSETFQISGKLDLLKERWSSRPSDLKPTVQSHSLSLLDAEMISLKIDATRRMLGGGIHRKTKRSWAGKAEGVRSGSVVRTMHVLQKDPMATVPVNSKVLDEWRREHGMSAESSANRPSFHWRHGAAEEAHSCLHYPFPNAFAANCTL